MPRSHVALLIAGALAACSPPPADANGRFEATELTLSAEVSGRLLALTAREGDAISAGALLGTVDTVPLVLQRSELDARLAVLTARRAELAAQGRALRTQADVAADLSARTERLAAAGAATTLQRDRERRDAATLADQVLANQSADRALGHELAAITAQRAQLLDRLDRAGIRSPINGVVLARYAEPGESVVTGAPLLKVAALDSLVLRAYISDAQLHAVTLGQTVTVQVDDGAGALRTLPGRVTWIAAAAEFTPTPIQTREERVTQVYAVTVIVPNENGRLRIGMPGELVLAAGATASRQD